MDPVGFTASVIGIETLAVQLADAVRKAAAFWETIQGAPSDISRLSRELRLVANGDVDQLSIFISELTRKLSRNNEKFKDNLGSIKGIMTLLQASRNQSSIVQINSKLDILDTKISSIAITSTSSFHQIINQSSLQVMQNRPVSSEHRSTYTNSVSKSIKQYRTNFFLGTFCFRTTSTTHRYDDNDSSDDADNSTTTRAYLVEFLV
ncbi:39ddf245-6cb6-4472-bd36-f8e5c72a58fd-CDS [Sclerotinia trifoliorum]|uniref:39ddf245-6cb6-4472-bd36-f8e5c72a58fd-CDS n=1 Tax=Sclerotinia trifoliorum TaxID=28548 RepID=A0A8H2W412_9HELO|nr:39ddf245-6cb6-4472-bd36-f8e5c72a58fd-CDS [Sclerotinia trifoliorum]